MKESLILTFKFKYKLFYCDVMFCTADLGQTHNMATPQSLPFMKLEFTTNGGPSETIRLKTLTKLILFLLQVIL